MNAPAKIEAGRSQAEQVASAIVKSGFWRDANPHAVLMLCYLAEAEGHHPAVVYRDYHMMSGKPSKKAEAILRDFIVGGGKIEWHQLDDNAADATFSHPSAPKGARITWTLERARTAGIAGNAMWKKYPRQMLRSRCISEGVRTVYPGATSGLYEEGEVADIVAESGGLVEGQSQAGTVSRDEPADYTPLEPHVEPTVVTGDYAFPEGPAKNITALKGLARSLWREIEGCGDETELSCLLGTDENKAIIKQLGALEHPGHRQIWEGDGKDNPGISGLITRKQNEFAQSEQNILAAG